MKLSFLILLFFSLLVNITKAQIPVPGSDITRSYLDKFEGTWKWVSGNSEVTIQLKKLHYYYSKNQFYEDVIVGSHKFVNNGITVEDFLPQFLTISQAFQSSIFLWANLDGTQPDIISGDLRDLLKHKSDLLKLTYIAGPVPSLTWHLREKGDSVTYPTLDGVTLPEDIVLVKQ